MKAKELMIGDWVRLVDNGKPCFRVAELHDDKLLVDEEDTQFLQHWFYDDIEPIPLTADILEVNGFGRMERRSGMEEFVHELDRKEWLVRYLEGCRACYVSEGLDRIVLVQYVYMPLMDDWHVMAVRNFTHYNDKPMVHHLQHMLADVGWDVNIVIKRPEPRQMSDEELLAMDEKLFGR